MKFISRKNNKLKRTNLICTAAFTILLVLLCCVSVYAGDIVVRSVNVGMSGSTDADGIVYQSYPVCRSTNQYNEFYTVTSSYYIDTDQTTYSIPYERWKAGDKIKVRVTLYPQNGYKFNSNDTKVHVIGKNTKLEGKTVKPDRVTVSLEYVASLNLPAVDANTVRLDDDNEYKLVWDPVMVDGKQWKHYEVRVMSDDAGSKSTVNKKVTTNSADISDMIMGSSNSIGIRSIGGALTSSKYAMSSGWTIIDGSIQSVSTTANGVFSGSGDKLIYLDESGNAITGWVKINGLWYYFDPANQGRAVVDGFKEIDGSWYYFDKNGVMKTGWVTVGDNKYYMSSNRDSDEGKMKTGWYATGPNGPYYFLNDGSIDGLPLGALLVNGITPDGYTTDETGKRTN